MKNTKLGWQSAALSTFERDILVLIVLPPPPPPHTHTQIQEP